MRTWAIVWPTGADIDPGVLFDWPQHADAIVPTGTRTYAPVVRGVAQLCRANDGWRLVRAGRLYAGNHADPFGRMLVAYAQVEKLTLVTRAARLKAYAVPILWA